MFECQSWTTDIHFSYIVFIITTLVILFTTKILLKKESIEEEIEGEVPKIVTDPGKAFAQNVKFVMRLKKRMKEFKARKSNK